MSIVYSNAVKVARMNAVIAAIDAGAGPASHPQLVIYTSSGKTTELVRFSLAGDGTIASGAAAGAGVLTFTDANGAATGTFNSTATNAGIAAYAEIQTAGGSPTLIITGLTVGTTGQDINLDNTNLAIGQAVTITTPATITHA